MERANHNRVSQIRIQCPKLTEFIPPDYNPGEVAGIIHTLREHACKLSREIVSEEIRTLSQDPPEDPFERERIKGDIIKKLKKLIPGSSSSINAMRGDEGVVTTSPDDIAKILKTHWGGVFSRKEVDAMALDIWMRELFIQDGEGLFLTGLPNRESGRWIIKRRAIAQAVKQAKCNMPGPDGISALAYKLLGELGIDILHDAASALCSEDGVEMLRQAYSDRCYNGTHHFNLSLLCCLPKKATGNDPTLGAYYDAEATRPLALVNTDNRIIASAARITWEPILASYISHHQQGFLKGRQMLNNIIDIDYHAMTVSLTSSKGAVIFFDFKAAFPSVSHDFLRRSLAHIGMPHSAMSFIGALYDHNMCNISFKGSIYEGFLMECGVRQGCPISPLLFAAAVDILLRKLQKDIPGSANCAFADDIALVIDRWKEEGGVARVIFEEFRKMSGLELNIPKTFVVPLWPKGTFEINNSIREARQDPWQNIGIADSAMYLGFQSGPGKGSKSWDGPIKKYISRTQQWKDQGLGTFFSITAYNTFAHSALLFVGQLEVPSDEVLAQEEKGIRKILRIPGGTFDKTDAFFFKELYGQPRSFLSVSLSARAAKLRVVHSLDLARKKHPDHSIRTIRDMYYKLEARMRETDFPNRLVFWGEWYRNAFATVLFKNLAGLEAEGISLNGMLASAAGGPPPWSEKACSRQKKFLQKVTLRAIKTCIQPDPVSRIRHKMERWFDKEFGRPSDMFSPRMLIPGPPNWLARRAQRNLLRLHALTPPRVCSAVIRGLWNSWCTAARYQRRDTPSDICQLGCVGAHDSIEHYCRCSVGLDVLGDMLKIHLSPHRALAFITLCTAAQQDDALLALGALYTYALYSSTNLYRAMGPTTPERAKQSIRQYILQGCAGHVGLTNLVDSRWRSPPFRL